MRKLGIVMALAFLVWVGVGAVTPAESLPCIAYGVCLSCTPTTAQPCFVVRCGTGPATYNCGSCVTDCVPPGF